MDMNYDSPKGIDVRCHGDAKDVDVSVASAVSQPWGMHPAVATETNRFHQLVASGWAPSHDRALGSVGGAGVFRWLGMDIRRWFLIIVKLLTAYYLAY